MVLSGWEGSVSDSALWLEGRRLGVLPMPDAGFANCDTCLIITPYRGVRYHLNECWGPLCFTQYLGYD
jgi:hypothetical protein